MSNAAETQARRIRKKRAVEQVDQAYYPPPDTYVGAYLFASRRTRRLSGRHSASIVISMDQKPFEMIGAGVTTSAFAVAIGPSMQRSTKGSDNTLVSVRLEPTHECFRAFCKLPQRGVLVLDRQIFSPFESELHAAVRGDLSPDGVVSLIAKTVAAVTPLLPKSEPQDTRLIKVCELVRREPSITLEEIAAALNLSYHRASHLFTQAIGLPFRSYRQWYKVRFSCWLLWAGESFTAAAHAGGFSDSAHFCRTFRSICGRPPSYFFNSRFVRIHAQLPSAINNYGHSLAGAASGTHYPLTNEFPIDESRTA